MPRNDTMPQPRTLLRHNCWCGKAHISVVYRPEINTTTFAHGEEIMDVLDSVMLQSGLSWQGMVDGFMMTVHQRDIAKQAQQLRTYQIAS